jgi:putative phosphoesterase
MVKIGIISDTHIQKLKYAADFFELLVQGPFKDVDMVFHAGDIVDPNILLMFADKPVHAVRGNMDVDATDLPQRKIITIAGFRFGLIHGWGNRAGLEGRLMKEFVHDEIDCLVYGHSHCPCCRQENGLLLFNPGSATDRRDAPHHTVGILSVGESITGEIIRLD